MRLTICSNCGCNLTDTEVGVYRLAVVIQGPTEGTVDTHTYDLCRCCAEGIDDILRENEERLLNLHGQNCEDILPEGMRCVHSHAGTC